jgi:hypothetical protein
MGDACQREAVMTKNVSVLASTCRVAAWRQLYTIFPSFNSRIPLISSLSILSPTRQGVHVFFNRRLVCTYFIELTY